MSKAVSPKYGTTLVVLALTQKYWRYRWRCWR